jgi:hypothetical protein
MNKKQLTVTFIILLSVSFSVFAENSNKTTEDIIIDVLTEDELSVMHSDLVSLTDQKMIESLSKTSLNDEGMKSLYLEFKKTIVTPPNPETCKEYSVDNADEALVKVTQLCRKIHNMLFAISDEEVEKYGNLLYHMRNVLYLDSKHIPLAIKHDNSRDVYWYELHNDWVKKAEDEYNKLFSQKDK